MTSKRVIYRNRSNSNP